MKFVVDSDTVGSSCRDNDEWYDKLNDYIISYILLKSNTNPKNRNMDRNGNGNEDGDGNASLGGEQQHQQHNLHCLFHNFITYLLWTPPCKIINIPTNITFTDDDVGRKNYPVENHPSAKKIKLHNASNSGSNTSDECKHDITTTTTTTTTPIIENNTTTSIPFDVYLLKSMVTEMDRICQLLVTCKNYNSNNNNNIDVSVDNDNIRLLYGYSQALDHLFLFEKLLTIIGFSNEMRQFLFTKPPLKSMTMATTMRIEADVFDDSGGDGDDMLIDGVMLLIKDLVQHTHILNTMTHSIRSNRMKAMLSQFRKSLSNIILSLSY